MYTLCKNSLYYTHKKKLITHFRYYEIKKRYKTSLKSFTFDRRERKEFKDILVKLKDQKNDLKLKERISFEVLQEILAKWDEVVKTVFKCPKDAVKDKKKLKEILRKGRIVEEDNVKFVEYNVIWRQLTPGQRITPDKKTPSISSIKKEIKQVLTSGYYKDIDMTNAIGHILFFFSSYFNFEPGTTYLKKFKDNREYYYSLLQDEELKTLFKIAIISTIYAGNIKRQEFLRTAFRTLPEESYSILHDFLVGLKKEIKQLNDFLWDQPELAEFRGYVQAKVSLSTKKVNLKSTFLAALYSSMESLIILEIIKMISKNSNIPFEASLSYDGFLVPKKLLPHNISSYLDDISQKLKEKWGITVSLSEKLMININHLSLTINNNNFISKVDENIQEADIICSSVPDTKSIGTLLPNKEEVVLEGDVQIIIHLLSVLQKENIYIKKDSESNLWILLDFVWVRNEKAIKSRLFEVIVKYNYYSSTSKNGSLNSSVTAIIRIISGVPLSIPVDDFFMENAFHSTRGKILFNDGWVFHFETKQFWKLDPKKEFFFAKVPFNSIDLKNSEQKLAWVLEEQKESVILVEKVLSDIFAGIEETKNYFLQYIAHSASMEMRQRKYDLFLIGYRHTGKSVLLELVKSAFGNSLVFPPYSGGVFSKARTSGVELEKALGILRPFYKTRIGFVSEIEPHETWNGVLLKRLVGESTFQCRTLYTDAINIYNQTSLVFLSNDTPKIVPTDAIDNFQFIELTQLFVPSSEFFSYLNEGFKMENLNKRNEKVLLNAKSADWGLAFLYLVLSNYFMIFPEPSSHMDDYKELVSNLNKVAAEKENVLDLDEFFLFDDPNSYLTIADIQQVLHDAGKTYKPNNLSRELKNKGVQTQRIGQKRVRMGIKTLLSAKNTTETNIVKEKSIFNTKKESLAIPEPIPYDESLDQGLIDPTVCNVKKHYSKWFTGPIFWLLDTMEKQAYSHTEMLYELQEKHQIFLLDKSLSIKDQTVQKRKFVKRISDYLRKKKK